ncbi:hypothetical protein F3Y22_tig00112498pilonHSYRG00004 [Hibiscus syriacus]|uniref:Rad21/Rec8-like protein N-terminal domain-containing protein n=1 Tax=Hibiscus syriacus TaxID=106335 RepID=A0A6A2Y6P5_HIBSY|nr:hypothetical protein F3Y22_tig00112498pilonHSYRG00004 [Hibiscus syriacus]
MKTRRVHDIKAMFISKWLVSKKGPLGAIWVAAFLFKKLKKSQIIETNISSSVDICVVWHIAALDDAFLKDYTLAEEYAQKFHLPGSQFYTSLSRHQMDFETEVRTLHGVRDSEASVEKLRCDNFFLEEVSHFKTVGGVEEEPQSLANENERERVEVPDMAGLVNRTDQEANREKYNDRLLSEEHVNLHTEAEEDSPLPLKLKPLAEDQTSREMMKGPDHLESEKEKERVNLHTEAEEDSPLPLKLKPLAEDQTSREMMKGPDHLESEKEKERLNLHTEAEEDSPLPLKLKPLAEDQTSREMMKGPDHLESENEMNQAMEEDNESVLEASAEFPDISGSASMEKCSNRFSSEGANLCTEADEEPLRPVESLVEDQRNRETMKELNLLKSENEVHPVLHEDRVSMKVTVEVPSLVDSENHIGREPSRENNNDELCQEECLNLVVQVEEKSPGLIKPFGEEETNRDMKSSYRVQPENEVHHVMVEDHKLGKVRRSSSLQVEGFFHLDIQEPSPLVRPLAEEIHTDAEHGKLPATRTSKYGNVRLLLKCIMRQWIKDASDLVSKRVKDGRTALGAMKTRWIPNLPQSFSEPSLPCILELKSVYCGKRLRHLESINITKHMDSPEPPAVSGFIEQAEITPVTVEMRILLIYCTSQNLLRLMDPRSRAELLHKHPFSSQLP